LQALSGATYEPVNRSGAASSGQRKRQRGQAEMAGGVNFIFGHFSAATTTGENRGVAIEPRRFSDSFD
jgi:hypothetical protein